MTETKVKTFSIRSSFLVPLGLLLVAVGSLLILSLMQDTPSSKLFLLGAILLPVAGLFIESLWRKATITPACITVKKPLRDKTLYFNNLTSIDTMLIKKRVFLTLSTEDDFLILSNAYADFPGLVQTIMAQVPAGVISDETRAMAENPPVKSSDIISCWIAVLLVSLILYLQFMQQFS